MPKGRGVRITILVEDQALERLAREVLTIFGFDRREMRVCPYPVGKNAKQWVTLTYPREVRAYRQEANHQQVALLTGTDADEQTVQQRCDALAAALETNRLPSREPQERIVLWIPKWHVETWLLALSGAEVTENEDCKHRAKSVDFPVAARAFVDRYRACKHAPDSEPLPSMKAAFHETQRLDP